MTLENTCFISYSRSKDPTAQRVMERFHKELSGQVAISIPKSRVFIDWALEPGAPHKKRLAAELCRSACMVLALNPYFFDLDHPFCAQEYEAMVTIEKARVGAMPELDGLGLIIPVIIRGTPADFPKALRDNVNCVSLDRDLCHPDDFKKRSCRQTLRNVAAAIEQRYRLLRKCSDLVRDCEKFRLPTEHKIRKKLEAWVRERPDPRYPGASR